MYLSIYLTGVYRTTSVCLALTLVKVGDAVLNKEDKVPS